MPFAIIGLVGLLNELLQVKNTSPITEPEFTSFDLSQLRDLPREASRPATATRPRRAPKDAYPHAVFPPAVPNNQP